MSRNSTNAFFFFFFLLLTSLIISQEAQADHLYSPAPAPEAHEPGKAPAPQAPHQPINTLPLHGTTPGSLRPQECEGKCGGRCSATAYKKPCMFFCQKCCATCLCVPPGTYGNKQLCPCYNNWKTKRGGPKCP